MDFINAETIVPSVRALYFLTARVIKILIFFVIHLFLLVIILFALWFFEIYPQDIRNLLADFFQGSLWLILSIFGVSLTSIVLLYWKVWKAISKKISGKFVWRPAITSFKEFSREKKDNKV